MIIKVSDPNFDQNGKPWGMGHGGNGCRGIPTTGIVAQLPMQFGDGANALASFWGAIAFAEYPLWNIATTYPVNIPVSYVDGLIYISKQAANTGNEPDTSPTWWTSYTPQTLIKEIFDLLTGQ